MSRQLTGALKATWNYDLWSSWTLRLSIPQVTPLLRELAAVNWPDHLAVDGAVGRFSWRNGELVLDLNVSKGCGLLNISVSDAVVNFDASKSRATILLRNDTSLIAKVDCKAPDSKAVIRATEKLGIALNVIVNVVGWLSLVATIALLFLNINLTYAFVAFLRMVKPLSRLKYINVSFGGIVEVFLATYQNPFQVSMFTRTNENVRLMLDSRSKLSRYFMPVYIFSTIPDKFVLYAVA